MKRRRRQYEINIREKKTEKQKNGNLFFFYIIMIYTVEQNDNVYISEGKMKYTIKYIRAV